MIAVGAPRYAPAPWAWRASTCSLRRRPASSSTGRGIGSATLRLRSPDHGSGVASTRQAGRSRDRSSSSPAAPRRACSSVKPVATAGPSSPTCPACAGTDAIAGCAMPVLVVPSGPQPGLSDLLAAAGTDQRNRDRPWRDRACRAVRRIALVQSESRCWLRSQFDNIKARLAACASAPTACFVARAQPLERNLPLARFPDLMQAEEPSGLPGSRHGLLALGLLRRRHHRPRHAGRALSRLTISHQRTPSCDYRKSDHDLVALSVHQATNDLPRAKARLDTKGWSSRPTALGPSEQLVLTAQLRQNPTRSAQHPLTITTPTGTSTRPTGIQRDGEARPPLSVVP